MTYYNIKSHKKAVFRSLFRKYIFRKTTRRGGSQIEAQTAPPSLFRVKDNQMMANPGKFQFMILSKNTIDHSIVKKNKTMPSKSVKLLGLNIDNKLNFGIHINNICKVASAKIKGLGRI